MEKVEGKPLYYVGHPSLMAKLLRMPRPRKWDFRDTRDAEMSDLREREARRLMLADAALTPSEKALRTLELTREEQQGIRKEIERNIEKYQRLEQRKNKKA